MHPEDGKEVATLATLISSIDAPQLLIFVVQLLKSREVLGSCIGACQREDWYGPIGPTLD